MQAGKTLYLWQIKNVLGGNEAAIALQAQALGLNAVFVKVCDGPYAFNIDQGRDRAAFLVNELESLNITPWGWGYIYGEQPEKEAQIAAKRVRDLKLTGFVVNAEKEFKKTGMSTRAAVYIKTLRALLPEIPIGFTSYRYPAYHPIPWGEFLQLDFVMPQIYWVGANDPGAQLVTSINQINAVAMKTVGSEKLILPIGCAYSQDKWQPTAEQLQEFFNTAIMLGLPAVSFWEWASAAKLGLLDDIGAMTWPYKPKDKPKRAYIEQRLETLEAWAQSKGYEV